MKQLAGLLIVLGLCLSGYAQDCGSTIVDGAGILGDSVAQIQAAADKLQPLGATVKVVTVKNFGSAGNLDRYERDMLKRCTSWQSPDGGRLSNLIVIMVEMEHREVGLYYGDLWRKALTSNWQSIKDDTIIPRLRDGNFSAAFTEALGEIATAIEVSKRAAVPVAASTKPTTVINQEAADLSGLWSILWRVVIIIVMLLLIVALIKAFTAWSNKRRERSEQQHRAKAAKTAVANGSNASTNALIMLPPRLAALSKVIDSSDLTSLEEQAKSFQRQHDNFMEALARLEESGAMDPTADTLTTEQYLLMEEAYEEVGNDFESLGQDIRDLEQEIVELTKLSDTLSTQLHETEANLASAQESVAAVASKGFKTDAANELLTKANEQLTQARETHAERKVISARDHYITAQSTMRKAVAAAQELPAQRDACIKAFKTATDAYEAGIALLDTARADFDQLSESYAETSWESVGGNGSQAEKLLAAAAEKLGEAEEAVSMESQQWDQATTYAENAMAVTEEAQHLLRDIQQRLQDVQAAEKKADHEIQLAQADLDKAKQFITAHATDVDIETLKEDLKKVEHLLKQAQAERAKKKPNFLMVVKTALQANAAADSILDRAEDQHEAMERKRARRVSLIDEVTRSIEAAERYMRSHRSDVGSTGNKDLESARAKLQSLERASNLDRDIEILEEADRLADNALDKAKRKVREAEEEEKKVQAAAAERQRREDDDDSFGSGGFSSGGFGGSRSSGGGGSSGFGSISFGGGGSSSFSAPSFGGGGSSKW